MQAVEEVTCIPRSVYQGYLLFKEKTDLRYSASDIKGTLLNHPDGLVYAVPCRNLNKEILTFNNKTA